jgi:putative endonuclease
MHRNVHGFFVYVLICMDRLGRRRTYVGWTTDPDRRLAAHNAGRGARSTRGRVWVLVHLEELPSRREAMSREWHLKRDRAFRKRLAEDWIARARTA